MSNQCRCGETLPEFTEDFCKSVNYYYRHACGTVYLLKPVGSWTATKISDDIFLGDDIDSNCRNKLRENNIDFVIDVRSWFDDNYVPLPKFRKRIRTISDLIERHSCIVLIHCLAGIDRSPFVVACVLMELWDIEPETAYEIVRNRRPQVIEHMDWFHKIP